MKTFHMPIVKRTLSDQRRNLHCLLGIPQPSVAIYVKDELAAIFIQSAFFAFFDKRHLVPTGEGPNVSVHQGSFFVHRATHIVRHPRLALA